MGSDDDGFGEFVAARSQSLLRTAFLLTHDWGRAEDLLQTSLAKSWLAWGRIADVAAREAYVRRVLVNTYATWWQRRWTGEQATGDLREDHGADPTSAVDEQDALWRAIGRLPRRQRAVVVLRFYEDLSEADTAALLGVAPGTVKSQTSKALAALRVDESLLGPTASIVPRSAS